MAGKWYNAIAGVAGEVYTSFTGAARKARQTEANCRRIAGSLTTEQERTGGLERQLDIAQRLHTDAEDKRIRAEANLSQARNLVAHMKYAQRKILGASLRVPVMRRANVFLVGDYGTIYAQTAKSRKMHGDLKGAKFDGLQYNSEEQTLVMGGELYTMILQDIERADGKCHQYAYIKKASISKELARAKREGGEALRKALGRFVSVVTAEVDGRKTSPKEST